MSSSGTPDVRRAGIGQWLFALIVFVAIPAATGASLARQGVLQRREPGPGLKHEPVREFYGDPKIPLRPRRAPGLDIPIDLRPPLEIVPLERAAPPDVR